jgi:hypothetical protein
MAMWNVANIGVMAGKRGVVINENGVIKLY